MYCPACQNFCWHFVQGWRHTLQFSCNCVFKRLSFKWFKFLDSFQFEKNKIYDRLQVPCFGQHNLQFIIIFVKAAFRKLFLPSYRLTCCSLAAIPIFCLIFNVFGIFSSIALKYNEPYIRYYKLCSALQSELSQLPVSQQARSLENSPLSPPYLWLSGTEVVSNKDKQEAAPFCPVTRTQQSILEDRKSTRSPV